MSPKGDGTTDGRLWFMGAVHQDLAARIRGMHAYPCLMTLCVWLMTAQRLWQDECGSYCGQSEPAAAMLAVGIRQNRWIIAWPFCLTDLLCFLNLTRCHKTLWIQKAQRRDTVQKSRVGVLPTILLTLAFKTTFKRFLILHCACAMVLLPVNKGSVLIRHEFKS